MRRFTFWLGFLTAFIGCLLLTLVKLVMSLSLESFFPSKRISLFSSLILGLKYPLEKLSQHWDLWIQRGLLSCIGLGLVVFVITRPTFFQRYVKKATAESLGVIRVLVCTILLAQTLWEDFASSALLPKEMRYPMGMLQLFYALPIGFDELVSNETGLQVLKWLTGLFLFLGMIGWQTRLVLPLGALGYFLLGGILRQYDHFYHTGLVPLELIVVLCFTPCEDGWSVDRLVKISQGQFPVTNRPASVYGWSRYACWVVLAQVYLAAGLSKLRDGGIFWWNPINMRFILYTDTLNPMQFDWGLSLHLSNVPDILVALFGIFGLLTELSFVSVLFSHCCRRILPFVIMMLHIGIFFLQNVPFFDLIALQLIFFDFTEIRKAIGRRVALNYKPIQILYDGFCPFCRRSVHLLECFDLFDRLEFVNFRPLNLAAYNRNNSLSLKLSELEKEMYVISQEKAYAGFYGYRVIALALPAFWLFAPWLFLPGVDLLGRSVYKYVARNRYKFVNCNEKCEIGLPNRNKATVFLAANNLCSERRYSVLIARLFSILMFFWICGIEFYPFTAWQMYADNNTSGIITYYKVLAHHQSGDVSRIHLEDAIGAMADGRYLKVMTECFEPTLVHTCEKFLDVSSIDYNHKTRSKEEVTQFEVQKWLWDFRSHPLDPRHGNLSNRFIFKIPKAQKF